MKYHDVKNEILPQSSSSLYRVRMIDKAIERTAVLNSICRNLKAVTILGGIVLILVIITSLQNEDSQLKVLLSNMSETSSSIKSTIPQSSLVNGSGGDATTSSLNGRTEEMISKLLNFTDDGFPVGLDDDMIDSSDWYEGYVNDAKDVSEDRTISSLMQHFPHCFPSTMTNYTNSVTQSAAQFLKGLDEAKFTIRHDYRHNTYNHMCFIMKPRYNCALPPGLFNNKSSAQDYKFIYQHESVNESENVKQYCDLEEVIDWLGGPTGIGRLLAQQFSSENESPKHHRYQVLLQGDSRLRQVIESLICRYSDKVTNLTLTFNALDLSINAIKKLKNKNHVSSAKHILHPNEMGQPRNIGFTNDTDGQLLGYDELLRRGCHNSDTMSDYYYPGVTVSTSIPGCSDDLLMVEFGLIRFYYIFRPQFYSDEALFIAYEKLGLTTSTDLTTSSLILDDNIDVLLWNVDNPDVRLLSEHRQKALVSYDWDGVHKHLRRVQMESIGTVYGAINPYVEKGPHQPDLQHSCMPGLPDDMVNIMLFSLLGGLNSPANTTHET